MIGRRLRQLRASVGRNPADKGDLLGNGLAFCSAVTTHHGAENDGMFTELLRARPVLEPVIANLVHDHQMIAAILTLVDALPSEGGVATSERPEAIRREFDALTAILESHFGYGVIRRT